MCIGFTVLTVNMATDKCIGFTVLYTMYILLLII